MNETHGHEAGQLAAPLSVTPLPKTQQAGYGPGMMYGQGRAQGGYGPSMMGGYGAGRIGGYGEIWLPIPLALLVGGLVVWVVKRRAR